MTTTAEERAKALFPLGFGESLTPELSAFRDRIAQAITKAENDKLEEAASTAEGTQTFEWRGGDEWAAGYVDGKNAAAARIRSLKKD